MTKMKLEISNIPFSKTDEKRCVTLPSRLNVSLAEEIGIHIGDGSMGIYGNTSLYSLRGHLHKDREFYDLFLKNLYERIFNIDVNLREWSDVYGFQYGSKAIINFKQNVLCLPLGPKKSISIPAILFSKKKFLIACILGIFATDGNIYFEKKPSDSMYPRISINTISKPLAFQIEHILENLLRFNLSVCEVKPFKPNWSTRYDIVVRGHENFKKWIKIIGSNHPMHKKEFKIWKNS